VEVLSDTAGVDRTAIHCHARRFGKTRQQEIPRHGLAGLVGFGRVIDVDLARPGTVFDAQQSDLAVGLQRQVVSAKGCGSGRGL
jgi:hypothetical protein